MGLSKKFGPRTALADLHLDFYSGVTAILGRNGAGKSTLIRILTSVAKAETGHCEYHGVNCQYGKELRNMRKQLGWLPQHFNVPLQQTLRHYLEYVGWLKNMPAKSRRAAAIQAAETVGLHTRIDDRLGTFSGGMVRRAGLAQAIVNQPKILILDEPTAGLDPHQRAQFSALVRSLAESSTVILATHLLEDVALTADRVVIIDSGRTRFNGTLTEFGGGDPAASLEVMNRRFQDLSQAAL